MIAIVDYGVGNLHSVSKAMQTVGAEVVVTSSAQEIASAQKLILPGVGCFGNCMQNLEKYGLVDAVKQFANSGKPFLGICVGLQILFEQSAESPEVAGLGILHGKVCRLPATGLKIPHIGWNNLESVKKEGIFTGIDDKAYVYFVHSYYVEPTDKSIVTSTVNYGAHVTASVTYKNIQAVQFHPEKSSEVGLNILRNFKEID